MEAAKMAADHLPLGVVAVEISQEAEEEAIVSPAQIRQTIAPRRLISTLVEAVEVKAEEHPATTVDHRIKIS